MSLLVGFLVVLVVLYAFMKHNNKRKPSTGKGNASNTIVVDRSGELDTDNRRPSEIGDDKSPVDWDNDSRHQL
jgi:hypothetical protein